MCYGADVPDNLAYARVILAIGMRQNASTADLSEILPEEISEAVRAASAVSMGVEITTDDVRISLGPARLAAYSISLTI